MNSTSGVVVWASPVLRAAARPPLSRCSTVTGTGQRATLSSSARVPSVEPSLTRVIVKAPRGTVWRQSCSRHARSVSARL